jgi:hypothetical protein
MCMSFNIHGIKGAPKMLALKRRVKSYALDVILLQETVCDSSKAVDSLSPWLKDCSFCSFDSDGHFGGLVTTWIPKLKAISSLLLNPGILVELEVRDLGSSFRIINPYENKKPFFEGLSSSGILSATMSSWGAT